MVSPVRNSDRVLLVEGQDDKHLVGQLCKREKSMFCVKRSDYELSVTLLSQASVFLISEKGGFSALRESIYNEVKYPGRQALGILVDADGDLVKRWEQVKKAFPEELLLPSLPNPAGTIVGEQPDHPRIGIWLMPDNRSAGELEDFVLQMVPNGDTVWPLSTDYIERIPASDRKFTPEKTDKAKLHAWLAARKEPGRMGAAVGAGDLEVTGSLGRDFLSWLARLFG